MMTNFQDLLHSLDIRLFEKIESQSTEADKKSFLAIQNAVRNIRSAKGEGEYNYLEIGSYLGGSIQPYLLDDKCTRIYSIDKRPLRQPDERGFDYTYENNSTARMLEQLKAVAPDRIEKIVTIDGDSGSIDPAAITEKIDLCLIDGEHTDAAVISDFKFCLGVLNESGCIAFHDAQITYNGIAECIRYLENNGIKFRAYPLPHVVFLIEIANFPLHKDPILFDRIASHESYLESLRENDHYRQFANRYPFRIMRNLYARLRGGNRSQ